MQDECRFPFVKGMFFFLFVVTLLDLFFVCVRSVATSQLFFLLVDCHTSLLTGKAEGGAF